MIKKYTFVIFLLTFVLLASCSKKEVLLPQVPISGPTDIQNHSEVWVFYNPKGQDSKAIINKNNLITSTNWILNIDRRLKLYDVIPVFQMVHAKRAKKNMHSVDGMTDYLSYSNTQDKNISVFPISDKKYLMLSWDEIEQLNQTKICENELVFYPNRVKVNGKMFTGISWTREIDNFPPKTCIQLFFDSNLTYQQYVKYRLELHNILPEEVLIQNTEYIIK